MGCGGRVDNGGAAGETIAPERRRLWDWAAETGVDHQAAEISLGHKVGSEVERAYRRTDMLERRRAILESWSQFLMGEKSDNVIKLEAGR